MKQFELPPIDSFRLSNILQHLDDEDTGANSLKQVARQITRIDSNYRHDVSVELERLFRRVELEDIALNRMEKLKVSLQSNDKLVQSRIAAQQSSTQPPVSSSSYFLFKTLSHTSTEQDSEYASQADALDLRELHDAAREAKRKFERITEQMKLIESNLPRRDRLFVNNSPHRHHYPKLFRYGLREETYVPVEQPEEPQEGPSAADISDVKLSQYIQLEQELGELEKRSKPVGQHPKGLANMGISPIRKSINPTSLLLDLNHIKSDVKLNDESVVVKASDPHEQNYIDDLKKYIHTRVDI